jgi:hypothetical protein
MPRRRAVRLVSAAFVVAAVPGLTARTARGRAITGCGDPSVCSKGTTCGFEVPLGDGHVACNKGCCQNTGDPVADRATAVCCNHNHEAGSWCCGKGYMCGSGANTAEDPNCRCPGVELPDGTCGCPPNSKKCGGVNFKCCKEGHACCIGPTLSPHCCRSKDDVCAAKAGSGPDGGLGGRACCPKERLGENQGKPFCCPPGTIAVGVSRTGGGNSRTSNRALSGGSCCPPGSRDCCAGRRCKDKEICVKGRCIAHVEDPSIDEG